ncbi:MAG: nitroreductase family protein [Acidimicrobiales bacterium]
MEFAAAVRARRMVRSFLPEPLAPGQLDRILALAARAPSAGNTAGVRFLALEGPEDTAAYWSAALPEERRAGFAWPGLLHAPALVLPVADAGAYVARYAEPDKAATGLGVGAEAWSVPYWHVDAGFAAMTILLAAVDEGLGALFFGLFGRTEAVKAAFSIPEGLSPVGVIALGRPAPEQRPGRSAGRPRPPLGELVHRGRWR